jgi:hypothetical protein
MSAPLKIRYGRYCGVGYAWTTDERNNVAYAAYALGEDPRDDWSLQNEALGILIGEVSETPAFGLDHRPINVDTSEVPDWVLDLHERDHIP